MGNLFAELKRRHIYRVAAAYSVVAWVLLQLVNNVTPIIEAPPWVARTILLVLVIGFPVALVLAWVLELKAADATPRAATGKLDWVLIGALVVVIGLVSYQQLAPTTGERTAQQQAPVATAASPASPAQPGGISIAVLPFVNLSGDPQQEFFSDGMTEEITSALAKIPNLRVVARTSAFEFKSQNRDVQSIAQALHATHLIEGSVRKDGNQLRITAQLIKANDATHLWTESYDRELKGVFAVQEEIAQAIAGALQVPLGLKQGETLVSDRAIDVDSYQQYLRARALFQNGSAKDAVAILEQVIARNEGYASAWALLATANRIALIVDPLVTRGSVEDARRQTQTSFDKAERAARKAIQLDPRNAGGYTALASLRANRGKWAEAEDLFHQALALDPNDPETLQRYRITLSFLGRPKEALRITEQLHVLEPFVPIYNLVNSLVMEGNGQNEAGIAALESIPSNTPLNAYRNIYLARAYAAAGRYTEAADTLLAIHDENIVGRGSVEAAASLIRTAPSSTKAPVSLPAFQNELHFVYAYVGARERMLENLERELQIGNLVDIGQIWFADFAPLRKTERFKAFVRNAGLVDYWRARGWPDLCRPMGADDFVCD